MKKFIFTTTYILFVSIIFISPLRAIAKCPHEIYKVQGRVIDANEIPLKNANISLFFDDSEFGYAGGAGEDGRFEIEYIYNTYKGPSFFGDRCGNIPLKLTVVVQLKDHFSKQENLKIKDYMTISDDNLIIIPSIILIRSYSIDK